MSLEDLTKYCYLNNLPISINKFKQDKDILIRVSIDKAFIFISCPDYINANKLLEFVNNNKLEAHEIFTRNHLKFKVFFDIDIENPKESPWNVDYGRLTPILIKAIQELSEQVKTLNAKVEDLQNQLANK